MDDRAKPIIIDDDHATPLGNQLGFAHHHRASRRLHHTEVFVARVIWDNLAP
jgi:hypothetical protein